MACTGNGFACGSGSLLLNVRKRMGPRRFGKIFGQEKNITTYNLPRMNKLQPGMKDTEFAVDGHPPYFTFRVCLEAVRLRCCASACRSDGCSRSVLC